jgi:ubiquinone/menaquinone biosynthesis C-methylase UbiE
MNCIDISEARRVYSNGGNITEHLRNQTGQADNSSDIIEIAYDMQAGSYIKFVNEHRSRAKTYTNEVASLLAPHLSINSSVLDVGAGELTTLSLVLGNKLINADKVFAFDISWSRLHHGMQFRKSNFDDSKIQVIPFVADMKQIPLATASIDVVTSSHALEPNGGHLPQLLKELFRVCKHRLVLFEPSYELNSAEGQARMDRLGYIKNIEGAVSELGGQLIDVTPVTHFNRPPNPTACYVIEPGPKQIEISKAENPLPLTVPGTDFPVTEKEGFYYSIDTGLAFPVLRSIPVLKADAGILATAFHGPG